MAERQVARGSLLVARGSFVSTGGYGPCDEGKALAGGHPTSDTDTGRFCPVHPEAPAAEVCHRCGRFLCIDCAIPREEAWYCQACTRRMAGLFGGSWLAVGAGICAFVGLGCAPLALAAAVLAAIDLTRIASGRGARGGWRLDVIALVLAVVGLVLGVFIIRRLV